MATQIMSSAKRAHFKANVFHVQTGEFSIKVLLQKRRTLLIQKQGQVPTFYSKVALWLEITAYDGCYDDYHCTHKYENTIVIIQNFSKHHNEVLI